MTKKQFTEFTCDSCKKKEVSDYGFPYPKQWVYIYNLQGKALREFHKPVIKEKFKDKGYTNTKEIHERDLHFCSQKCLLNFIKEKFKTGFEKKEESKCL